MYDQFPTEMIQAGNQL